MNIKTKKILSLLFILSIFAVPAFVGAQFEPGRGSDESNLSTISFYDLLITIMKYLLGILTVLAIIGFIVSGIIFITAGGASKADMARNYMIYSIIGIIVGLIGYIVIILVDSLIRGETPLS